MESGKVRAWNLPIVSTIPKFYLPYPIPTSILGLSYFYSIFSTILLYSTLLPSSLGTGSLGQRGLFGRGELAGVCLAAHRVTLGAREV